MTQIVGEMLPAFDQAGAHVEPGKMSCRFDEQQDAARRQQGADGVQRIAQVARCMHRIGCDDQIERAGGKALRYKIALKVELGEPHERPRRIFVAGAVKERQRHVGEPVGRRRRRAQRDQCRGRAAGPGADLEYAQRRARWARRDQRLKSAGGERIAVAHRSGARVEVLGHCEGAIGEQRVERTVVAG